MPRKGIICSMCGGEFFERSFPIHQKACAAKQQHIRLECQHCHQEVPKLELEQHLARCPKAPKPQMRSKASTSTGPISNVFDSLNRLQCAVCGRWFNADRVAKHQGICSSISNKRRPVFDSFSQRRFDPQIHRAAPAATRRCSTSSAVKSSDLAAARSYYSFAPCKEPQCPVSKVDTASETRHPLNRGGVAASRSKNSGSQLPVPSSRRSSVSEYPTAPRPSPRTKAGVSSTSVALAGVAARKPPRSQPILSQERCQASWTTGSSRQPSPVQVSGPNAVGKSGNPLTSSRINMRQPNVPSRFAGSGRDAPPPRIGRGSPHGAGGGGGQISTSNICSPCNPLAYPNYPS